MEVAGVYRAIAVRSAAITPPDGSVYVALDEALDPANARPALAPGVELKTFQLRWGNDYAMIFDPRSFQHFRLEPGEAELVPLMDGSRSVKDIVVERFQDSGELEMSGVVDLVSLLHTGGLLETGFVDVPGLIRRKLHPQTGPSHAFRRFLRTLSVEWRGAHGLVVSLYRGGLRAFFVPWVNGASGVVALIGFVAFLSLEWSGRFGLGGPSPAAETLILLALNYFLTFMHELGHAAVLVHHGRRVGSAGFMLYFGSPTFFVDASDGLMMNRWPRIWQAFAGPFAELVIAGGASIAVLLFPDGPAAGVLYKFALLNYLVIFLNLIPLLELDGYWILSDLIQVPDLRPRSLQFVRYDLWRKVRARQRLTKQELGLALYGTLGVAFAAFALVTAAFFWKAVFGGLVSTLWEGGPVTRILLIVLGLFLAGPLLRGLADLLRSLARKLGAAWRLVRFRSQTGWRVEAARLIDGLPAFGDLPEDVLSDLAGRVVLRSWPAGRPVVRQGDRAESFFLVRRGTLEVLEEDPETGDERVLRVLGRGESFGEVALATSSPRTATVRARTPVELFEVDRSTFQRLLVDAADIPTFAPTFQAIAELRSIPAFATLEPDEILELLEHGSWTSVAPGDVLIEQGAVGDAFYVIGSGQLDVVRDGSTVSTLGPGSHVGEVALLRDAPRNATVVARTPGRVFRLDREGFDAIMVDAFKRGTVKPSAGVDRTWQH